MENKHNIIYKNKKEYYSFPILDNKNDILTIGFFNAPYVDHLGINDWKVFQSYNKGESWTELSLLSKQDYKKNISYHPYTFFKEIPPRVIYDKYMVVNEIRRVVAGGLGVYTDKKTKSKRPSASYYWIYEDRKNNIFTQEHKPITGVEYVFSFPRSLELNKGQIVLVPMYGKTKLGDAGFLLRTGNWGRNWDFIKMFPDCVNSNEMAFIEKKNKEIIALMRNDESTCLLQSISKDKGKSWSYPTITNIKGVPPHLLRLQDTRLLCTVCDRKVGGVSLIQAWISEDEGTSWKLYNTIDYSYTYSSKLHKIKWYKNTKYNRDRLAWNDVGYPVSTQLKDGTIFTVYYITREDRITGIESCKWRLED